MRGMKWLEFICARYEVAGVDLCGVWGLRTWFVRGMEMRHKWEKML